MGFGIRADGRDDADDADRYTRERSVDECHGGSIGPASKPVRRPL
jgi:hypothetical protein